MRLAPILAAGALLLAAAPAAQAFGTINGLGQNAEHEKITRLALRCGGSLSDRDCFGPRTLDVLAGKRGTFGMVGGPDSGSLLLQSSALNVMRLTSPQSAIASAVIFNALIIIFLIPLALRGVRYRPVGAATVLRDHLLIYGAGGLIVPFIGIKVIDVILTVFGLAGG